MRDAPRLAPEVPVTHWDRDDPRDVVRVLTLLLEHALRTAVTDRAR